VAAGIALSRLSGLIRERVIAQYLGVGPATDAFRAAMRIPNLLQNLLGEGVLSASFIPVQSRLVDEDPDRAGRTAGAVASLLTLLTGAVAVLAVLFARPITVVLAPGFGGERLDLTVRLVRIITPGVGLLVLSAWCLGILNSHRRFFLSYVAPVLWNVAQITVLVTAGVRGWATDDLALALAWGTLVGGLLQLAVQVPTVIRLSEGRLRFAPAWSAPDVAEVRRRFVPVVAGRGVVQLSAYVDLMLASLLATGAVAALGFAQVLHLLPISLFGMSVAAAELPELSRLEAASPAAERVRTGLTRIAFFVVPTAVGYVLVGDLVVETLFGAGQFGRAEVVLVWAVTGAMALGLLAATASRLLQSACYAAGDTAGPAAIAAGRVVIGILVGVALMFPLDRVLIDAGGSITGLRDMSPTLSPLAEATRSDPAGALRLGAVGLGLGAAVAAWVELALLRRRVRQRLGRLAVGGGRLATIAAGVGLATIAGTVARVGLDGAPAVVTLAGVGLAAAPVYVTWCARRDLPDAVDLRNRVLRR